jgi:hypothetical protein
MKRLILVPILVLSVGCNESTDTAKIATHIEAPIVDEPPIDPPPVEPPPTVQGACAGNYLVGTWQFTPTALEITLGVQPETLTIGEDCVATSAKCGFDFEVPPEGYTAEFATGLGWDGQYNFRVRHITAPQVLNPGCQQFQNVFTAWHNCNVFANSNDSMTLSCGPLVFGNNAYNYVRQ